MLPDAYGIQFVLYRPARPGEMPPPPVSLPPQQEGPDGARAGSPRSLSGLGGDEVRRQIFEMLYGFLSPEQVRVGGGLVGEWLADRSRTTRSLAATWAGNRQATERLHSVLSSECGALTSVL